MDESYDFTDPARPGRRFTCTRQIGLSLTAYAIAALSEYLRRDPIAATDEELLAKFEDEVSLHAHWWEQEVTRAEELAAEGEAEATAATGDGTADRSGA
jgi:hypothetical protein